MSEYLPDVYTDFREAYPEVAQALDDLGAAAGEAGPLDERWQRLIKLERLSLHRQLTFSSSAKTNTQLHRVLM